MTKNKVLLLFWALWLGGALFLLWALDDSHPRWFVACLFMGFIFVTFTIALTALMLSVKARCKDKTKIVITFILAFSFLVATTQAQTNSVNEAWANTLALNGIPVPDGITGPPPQSQPGQDLSLVECTAGLIVITVGTLVFLKMRHFCKNNFPDNSLFETWPKRIQVGNSSTLLNGTYEKRRGQNPGSGYYVNLNSGYGLWPAWTANGNPGEKYYKWVFTDDPLGGNVCFAEETGSGTLSTAIPAPSVFYAPGLAGHNDLLDFPSITNALPQVNTPTVAIQTDDFGMNSLGVIQTILSAPESEDGGRMYSGADMVAQFAKAFGMYVFTAIYDPPQQSYSKDSSGIIHVTTTTEPCFRVVEIIPNSGCYWYYPVRLWQCCSRDGSAQLVPEIVADENGVVQFSIPSNSTSRLVRILYSKGQIDSSLLTDHAVQMRCEIPAGGQFVLERGSFNGGWTPIVTNATAGPLKLKWEDEDAPEQGALYRIRGN